ncbi:hypothetical protein BDZ89DRAFT_1042545 [Hymenopellis radicata]|nr:hypothetical protein BDZ89DRAFT_1042545 [Hymenopellis radicata]
MRDFRWAVTKGWRDLSARESTSMARPARSSTQVQSRPDSSSATSSPSYGAPNSGYCQAEAEMMRIAYHDVDPDLVEFPESEIREQKKSSVGPGSAFAYGGGGSRNEKNSSYPSALRPWSLNSGSPLIWSSICWLYEAFERPVMKSGLRSESGGMKSIDAFSAPYAHRAGSRQIEYHFLL